MKESIEMKNTDQPQTFVIPPELWPYQKKSAYFITYYGEIYFGIITECPNYSHGCFIVQNDKIKKLQDLPNQERTPETYRALGREIRDVSVIREIREQKFGREIDFRYNPQTNKETYKRMFVFGAGASKFCLPKNESNLISSQYWPPMGDEVFSDKFSELLKNFPGAQLYLANQKIRSGNEVRQNVEEQMQSEWEHFKYYMDQEKMASHINIQFYLAELLRRASKCVMESTAKTNLYDLFLQNLKSVTDKDTMERISLVTFNYDTILDSLITRNFGYSYQSMNDYRNWTDRNILLFKPHGSCNWGWKLNGELPTVISRDNLSNKLYEGQTSLNEIYFKLVGDINNVVATNTWGYEYHNDRDFRGRFTLDKSLIEHISPDENELFYPSILIPYKDKDEFFMPYDHFNAMKQVVNQVEELYLIGWKGSEALFNKQLKQMTKLKKLVIVNPDASEVHQNIVPFIGTKDYKIECVDTFEEFVLNWMPKHFEI